MIDRKPISKAAKQRRTVAVHAMGRSAFFATGLCLLVAGCAKPSPESANEIGSVAEPGMQASNDPLILQARGSFEPIPVKPPTLPGNPATAEKVALGSMLYFDPRLSATHSISCHRAACVRRAIPRDCGARPYAATNGVRHNREALCESLAQQPGAEQRPGVDDA